MQEAGFAKKQRFKDLLDEICETMTEDGRKRLLDNHNNGNQDIKLSDLVIEQREGKLINRFEGFHVVKFTESLSSPANSNSNEKFTRDNLNNRLKANGIKSYAALAKYLPYSSTATVKYVLKVFDSIAKFKGIFIAQVLLQFLQFCKKEKRPLRVFESNDEFENTIRELTRYVDHFDPNIGLEDVTDIFAPPIKIDKNEGLPLEQPIYVTKKTDEEELKREINLWFALG